MRGAEVIRLAGQPAVLAAGVLASSADAEGETYMVRSDLVADPDPANATWIYWIASPSSPEPQAGGGRCLFVELRDGVVFRT